MATTTPATKAAAKKAAAKASKAAKAAAKKAAAAAKAAAKKAPAAATPPTVQGGLLMAAKALPAKVASQIGTPQTVNNTPAIITHVGAIATRTNWGKPQLMAVHAIVKLLQAGNSVLAANTCRYLTAKSMGKRANQQGTKLVIVVNNK